MAYLLVALSFIASGGVWAAACTVSAIGVAFGTYDRLTATPKDNTGTVTVTCTTGVLESVSYAISLSAGTSGLYFSRQLSSGANRLSYNLYIDSARTTIWGNGTNGTTNGTGNLPALLLGGTRSQASTIYGRMPAGQNIPAGSYTDTITVTVTY